MSDLRTAAKIASEVLDRVNAADKMAMCGTYEHNLFLSASLMNDWSRLKFCLEVLTKQR